MSLGMIRKNGVPYTLKNFHEFAVGSSLPRVGKGANVVEKSGHELMTPGRTDDMRREWQVGVVEFLFLLLWRNIPTSPRHAARALRFYSKVHLYRQQKSITIAPHKL